MVRHGQKKKKSLLRSINMWWAVLLLSPMLAEGHNEVKIATETSLFTSAFWVARDQGYFEEQGLTVTLDPFNSGRNALENMLIDSSIHLSTAPVTAIVFNSFNDEEFRIIADISNAQSAVKVLAQRQTNIFRLQDLRGRNIGLTARSSNHYFLSKLLDTVNLTINDVQIKDFSPNRLAGALQRNEVDAITAWEPHFNDVLQALDANSVSVVESQQSYRKDFYLTGRKEFLAHNQSVVKMVLRALIKADRFIEQNALASQDIVAQALALSPQFVSSNWNDYTMRVFLDLNTLDNLVGQSRWVIRQGLINASQPPNYWDYLDARALRQVNPDEIQMTHH